MFHIVPTLFSARVRITGKCDVFVFYFKFCTCLKCFELYKEIITGKKYYTTL